MAEAGRQTQEKKRNVNEGGSTTSSMEENKEMNLKAEGVHHGEGVQSALTENVTRLRETASEVAGKVKDQASHLPDTVSTSMHDHPTNTVLISFAAGCLAGIGVGFLLSGRKEAA